MNASRPGRHLDLELLRAGHGVSLLPMRVFVFLLVSGLIGGVAGVASGELAWEKTLDEQTVQHGPKEIRAAFPFQNVGAEDVEITQIITSCGCTAAILEKRVYKPGEQGVVTGIFRPGDRMGQQDNTIEVRTSPSSPTRNRLRMRTNIERDLYLDRTVLFWSRERPLKPVVVRAKITAREPMEITGVQSSDPRIKAALGTVEKGKVYRIEVVPRDLREAFDATVTVRVQGADGKIQDSEIRTSVR